MCRLPFVYFSVSDLSGTYGEQSNVGDNCIRTIRSSTHAACCRSSPSAICSLRGYCKVDCSSLSPGNNTRGSALLVAAMARRTCQSNAPVRAPFWRLVLMLHACCRPIWSSTNWPTFQELETTTCIASWLAIRAAGKRVAVLIPAQRNRSTPH